jgi:hypothetical protein
MLTIDTPLFFYPWPTTISYFLLMNSRLQIAIIALVVTTMALAPSLVMNQSAEAASHKTKCEAEKRKSESWINGCKEGWFNWDNCGTNYPTIHMEAKSSMKVIKLDGRLEKRATQMFLVQMVGDYKPLFYFLP